MSAAMDQLVDMLVKNERLRWVQTDSPASFVLAARSGCVVLRAEGVELRDRDGNMVGDRFSSPATALLHTAVTARLADRDALALALLSDLEPF